MEKKKGEGLSYIVFDLNVNCLLFPPSNCFPIRIFFIKVREHKDIHHPLKRGEYYDTYKMQIMDRIRRTRGSRQIE